MTTLEEAEASAIQSLKERDMWQEKYAALELKMKSDIRATPEFMKVTEDLNKCRSLLESANEYIELLEDKLELEAKMTLFFKGRSE
jgi:hypothetical protein